MRNIILSTQKLLGGARFRFLQLDEPKQQQKKSLLLEKENA